MGVKWDGGQDWRQRGLGRDDGGWCGEKALGYFQTDRQLAGPDEAVAVRGVREKHPLGSQPVKWGLEGPAMWPEDSESGPGHADAGACGNSQWGMNSS